MLTLRLGPESCVDLPSGEIAEIHGDELLVKDARGSVVAKAEKLCVLAYGREEVLHAHTLTPRYARDVFPRYQLVRRRYLMLEEELHQMLMDARANEGTAPSNLAGLASQVARVHDAELLPLLEQIVQSIVASRPRAEQRESARRSEAR